MNKKELAIKAEVKRLASKLGFQSVMFADEFENSSKEDLRYLLWLVELTKWLMDNYSEDMFSIDSQFHYINFMVAVGVDGYLSVEMHKLLTTITEKQK